MSTSVIISGEDGRSRAEQLLHILRQLDPYVSSAVEYQRERGCRAAHEMLLKFRTLCISGYCALGCQGSCTHAKKIERVIQRNYSNLPCKNLSTCLFSVCVCVTSSIFYVLMLMVICSFTTSRFRIAKP